MSKVSKVFKWDIIVKDTIPSTFESSVTEGEYLSNWVRCVEGPYSCPYLGEMCSVYSFPRTGVSQVLRLSMCTLRIWVGVSSRDSLEDPQNDIKTLPVVPFTDEDETSTRTSSQSPWFRNFSLFFSLISTYESPLRRISRLLNVKKKKIRFYTLSECTKSFL